MTPCEGGGSRRNTITIESLFEIDRDTQNVAWKRFLADSEWIEIKKVTAARWGALWTTFRTARWTCCLTRLGRLRSLKLMSLVARLRRGRAGPRTLGSREGERYEEGILGGSVPDGR